MNNVNKLCGKTPDGFIKIDFDSNPNFIFETDTAYLPVQLFDSEGNSVIVNSFIECEHYVSGGWVYEPPLDAELLIQNYLAIFVGLLVLLSIFLRKKFS